MGYCGIKIPGHTGTDFKHKKVFTNQLKIQNEQSKLLDVKIESRDPKTFNEILKNLHKVIALSFMALTMLLVSVFAHRIDTLSIQKDKISIQESIVIHQENQTAERRFQESLYTDAKIEFQYGNYTKAHEKLYALLLVDQNNPPAENLLIKVLSVKCEKFNIGCHQLEKYAKYIDNKRA